MSQISFKASKKANRGYVMAELVPTHHNRARGADAWGMTIAGGLLLLATAFICLLILAV
jgi:hypothetical protein